MFESLVKRLFVKSPLAALAVAVAMLATPMVSFAGQPDQQSLPPATDLPESATMYISSPGSGSAPATAQDVFCDDSTFVYTEPDGEYAFGGETLDCSQMVAQIELYSSLYLWDEEMGDWTYVEGWQNTCYADYSCVNWNSDYLWEGTWRITTRHVVTTFEGGEGVAWTARNVVVGP